MAIIEWKDEYSVGIQSIDQQHKIWVGLINKLHDAMKKGEGKKAEAAWDSWCSGKMISRSNFNSSLIRSLMNIFSLSHVGMAFKKELKPWGA